MTLRRLGFPLALLVTSSCLAATAAASTPAAPQVGARAWLVENGANGEILVGHAARARLPIASITKLMTVLVALDHHKLTDVVQIDPRATTVGEESAHLRPGERLTIRDLVKAALIQSANDAAAALALSVAPDFPAFAELMNAKAARIGLTDSHFVRPDGLDASGEVSSARDATELARQAMKVPFVRETVATRDATIAGGRPLHTWDDLLGVVPGLLGVKTGHTLGAGWSQVAAVRGRGLTIYATILGSSSRSQRNADLQTLLAWGLAQYRVVDAITIPRRYAAVALPYGRRPLGLVAAGRLTKVVRVGRPLTERVVAPTAVGLPVERGAVLGRVEVWDRGRLLGSRPLIASRAVPRPGLLARLGWYSGRTVRHVVGFF